MCDFCKEIFDGYLLWGNFRGKSKNKLAQEQERERWHKWSEETQYEDCLIKDHDSEEITVFVETGDPFCEGYLQDVKYCPYCGRKLNGNNQKRKS